MTTPIIATIDDTKSVRLNVNVIGTCKTQKYSGVFDSGFNGDIVMPQDLAVSVGLDYGGATTVELADGSTTDFPIYLCDIEIGGIKQSAAIIVMGDEMLIGMGIMAPFKVCIQPSTSEAIIEPVGSYVNFVNMMKAITE